MNDWESISFILAGKKRRKVLEILYAGPKTPTQIAQDMDVKISNVSVTLKELLGKDYIQNMTPGVRKGKILRITGKGRKILRKIGNIDHSKKKR